MEAKYMSDFRAKKEEIERKKAEVRERVQSQLSRVEEETKKLAGIRKELEVHVDHPDSTKTEVASIRKKIVLINKDLKKIDRTYRKKEKELQEAKQALKEKNKQKAELMDNMYFLVTQSERLQMMKLEELSKNMDSLL